jgi:hypothetical protein
MAVSSRALPLAAAALMLGACTPKESGPKKVKYDGPVAAALAELAKDCVAYGISAGQEVAKAADLKCTGDGATMLVHLDKSRQVRSLQIDLVAPSTEIAAGRLDTALALVLDEHHRKNALLHLDDEVPAGINPIPQLALEGFLYQVASTAVDETSRKYVFRVRID